jgi:glutamate formiminotransferase/formiminotetrahydrofolate cyclodeaminase
MYFCSMGKPILLCVPNFSEGRDERVVQAILDAIGRVPEVRIMAVDRGVSVNRTVVSFGGPVEAVFDAARASIETALKHIDMRLHKGVHPRMGAVDVCPFIPYRGIDRTALKGQVEAFARDIGDTFKLPVYLYAESARTPERVRLPNIRRGGYEKLAEKLKDPNWAPDFGPPILNTRSGAIAIGVRDFIAAFNITLNSRSEALAKRIAAAVRESGTGHRLPGVQAIGWYLPEVGFAQVSLNVTDLRAVPLHKVLELVEEVARSMGARVSGTEIVGILPEWALLEAGRYYAQRAGEPVEKMSPKELVEIAVRSLMLTDFRPEERLPEWVFGPPDQAPELAEQPLREVIWRLADPKNPLPPEVLPTIQSALTLAMAARLSAGLPARNAFLHTEYMQLVEKTLEKLQPQPLSIDEIKTLSKNVLRGFALLRQMTELNSTIQPNLYLLLAEAFMGSVESFIGVMLGFVEKSPDVKQDAHDMHLQGKFFLEEITKKLKL